jgi:hypothetical protein
LHATIAAPSANAAFLPPNPLTIFRTVFMR